ncbi:MAG TPA: hypothetical protein VKE22_12295 [Haliangiales bacterium]|nr:hypothetical protein [Haliangiales bacterium]
MRAFAVHPGAIVTDLMRSLPPEEIAAIQARLAGTTFKTTEQGAATSVWCAASAQLDGMGGVYCEDVEVATPVAADATSLTGVRPWRVRVSSTKGGLGAGGA